MDKQHLIGPVAFLIRIARMGKKRRNADEPARPYLQVFAVAPHPACTLINNPDGIFLMKVLFVA
ncbi:hypothetical protein D3C73_1656090 [compost metagenome]